MEDWHHMAPLLLHSVSKGLWSSSFYLWQAPEQPPPLLTGCLAASHRKQLFVLCKWWLMSRLAQRAVSDKLLMASLSEVLVQVTEPSILRWITAQSSRCTKQYSTSTGESSSLAFISRTDCLKENSTLEDFSVHVLCFCADCLEYPPYQLLGYFKRLSLICCLIIHTVCQRF